MKHSRLPARREQPRFEQSSPEGKTWLTPEDYIPLKEYTPPVRFMK
jgi:hypothetical protein